MCGVPIDGLNVYLDFEELPLDDPPPDEGDAGPPLESEADEPEPEGQPPPHLAPMGLVEAVQGILLVTKNKHVILPFGRAILRDMKGADVVAVKRALSTYDAKAYPWRHNWAPQYGEVAEKAMKKFQHRHAIQATGKVGRKTIRALAPYFDQYGFKLYTGFDPHPHPADPTLVIRAGIYADCLWSYNHRDSWHYRQWRPIDGLHVPHKLPIYVDCSGGATCLYRWNGGPDPNDNGWNGQGYTGSMAAACRHISPGELRQADFGFYATPLEPAPRYAHVIVALGYKRDGVDLCWSNGSEGAPYLAPINYRGFPDLYASAFAA